MDYPVACFDVRDDYFSLVNKHLCAPFSVHGEVTSLQSCYFCQVYQIRFHQFFINHMVEEDFCQCFRIVQKRFQGPFRQGCKGFVRRGEYRVRAILTESYIKACSIEGSRKDNEVSVLCHCFCNIFVFPIRRRRGAGSHTYK